MEYRRSSGPGNDGWRSRVRLLMVRSLLPTIFLLAEGCATYWGWRPLDQTKELKPYNEVRIWNCGTLQQWHGVVITQDSISGIPKQKPLTCDDCRRSIPLTQVDSLKVGYQTLPEYIIFGAIIAALVLPMRW
jgi:hypothetical protein